MRFFILLEGDILTRMTDEAYMQRALELALQAEGNTSPVSYTHLTLPTTPYV